MLVQYSVMKKVCANIAMTKMTSFAHKAGNVIKGQGAMLCRHVTAASVHTFLVIDCSGSMAARSVTPDNHTIRSHPHFNGLDNVLGVVYEAVYKYLCERSSRAPEDLLTFIPFSHHARVCIASQPISDVHSILDTLMQFKPRKGTVFCKALACAHRAMQQVRFPSRH
jgi:hypothetical protein